MATHVFVAACALSSLAAAAMAMDESRRVTSVIDSYPSASPDGRRLVFQSNRSGTSQIHVMNLDGSELRRLTDVRIGARTPKWSPDGREIVYTIGTDDTSDIWLMAADGSAAHALIEAPGDDSHPQWTPDGAAIVFNSSRTSPPAHGKEAVEWDDVFMVRRDGNGLRQLTHCHAICTYPSLAPDGRRMAYRRVVNVAGFDWSLANSAVNSEVVVANIDGSDERNLSNNAAFDGWPAWSPDGTWIAFASNRAGPANTGQIYLVHPDGSALHAISSGHWSRVQPAWSRDARTLYVYEGQESGALEFGAIAALDVAP